MPRNYPLAAFLALVVPDLRGQAPLDWPTFLARQDLVWERLPEGWGESAFIGNGRLGATIDVQNGTLGWTVNRTDVVHDQSRFPTGRVVLNTAGRVTGGTARLVLWDAEAIGTLTTDRGEVHWRSFVAREPSVIVIALRGRGGEAGVDLGWVPAEARPPRKIARREPFAPTDLHPPPVVTPTPAGITSVQSFIGGDAHAEAITRSRPIGGESVFYISIGYGSDGGAALAEAQAATSRAARQGLERLARDHRAWWHAYYPASFLSFPDARLEAYYWIQIYKLGSAMRPDGPILDLNGPWFRHTPWPAIWWNLNIQLTYSPLFKANRLDLAESLFRNLDRGRDATPAKGGRIGRVQPWQPDTGACRLRATDRRRRAPAARATASWGPASLGPGVAGRHGAPYNLRAWTSASRRPPRRGSERGSPCWRSRPRSRG